MSPITASTVADQEECFARAFGSGDLEVARHLYHPEVVYLSPTVRLFGWPVRIEGVDRALEFIGVTITGLEEVRYRAVENAILPNADSAFVLINFDLTIEGKRLRCNYVVIYRYRDGLISRQELYYDPSGQLEVLSDTPGGGSEKR